MGRRTRPQKKSPAIAAATAERSAWILSTGSVGQRPRANSHMGAISKVPRAARSSMAL
jgi:hypothetical protein